MKWFESAACRSRRHCAGCRNHLPFREALLKNGLVAIADFACPFGFSVTHLPRKRLGDRIATVTHALHIQQCGGCKQMQADLNAGVPFRKALKKRFTHN